MKITFGNRGVEVKPQPPFRVTKQQPPTPRPAQPRKTRSDKRVRSTLRISREMDDMIKAIAYNHDTIKQKVVDFALRMVLGDDLLRSQLIRSMPKQQRHPYLFMDE